MLFDRYDLGLFQQTLQLCDYVVVPSYATRIIVLEYQGSHFGPPSPRPINNVTFDRLESAHFYSIVVVGDTSSSTVPPFILDMGTVSKPLYYADINYSILFF